MDGSSFGWECSQEFDFVLRVIAKNRKLILAGFKNILKRKESLTFEDGRTVLSEILEQNGVKLNDQNWHKLLKFAIKNDKLDYEFMLEIFKQRQEQIVGFPQARQFI